MSGSLLDIKKQMAGVANTRKITKAMQLVAASKMRQFQRKALTARSFAWELLEALESNLGHDPINVYTKKREGAKKVLFVLYTSDKGLCGGLNTKLINGLFRSKQWKDLAEDERMLITIGKKSFAYAQSNKIKVTKNFEGIPEKLEQMDVIKVVESIFDLWAKDTDIKEVVFIAPHYKNSFTFYPVMRTLLPFSEESVEDSFDIPDEDVKKRRKEMVKSANKFMIFSPAQEDVLNRLYEQIIQASFIQSFLELKASEYSSRMIAMQNATDSADRIIGDLKRTYNKARQQAITQEIAELIGASIALEDAS